MALTGQAGPLWTWSDADEFEQIPFLEIHTQTKKKQCLLLDFLLNVSIKHALEGERIYFLALNVLSANNVISKSIVLLMIFFTIKYAIWSYRLQQFRMHFFTYKTKYP